MNPAEIFRQITNALDIAGISYMLTGCSNITNPKLGIRGKCLIAGRDNNFVLRILRNLRCVCPGKTLPLMPRVKRIFTGQKNDLLRPTARI
jgi:hypothetical protein